MQRSAIRTRARKILKEKTPDFFQDDTLNDWIDDGVWDVQRRSKCFEVICTAVSTVSLQKDYDNPIILNTTAVTTFEIRTILNSGNVSLTKISIDLIGREATFGVNPQYFAEWGSEFRVSPTPTAVYSLTPCIVGGTGLTADATDPHVSVQYQPLIPVFVAHKALQRIGDFQQAAILFAEYDAELTRIYILDKKVDEKKEIGSNISEKAL